MAPGADISKINLFALQAASFHHYNLFLPHLCDVREMTPTTLELQTIYPIRLPRIVFLPFYNYTINLDKHLYTFLGITFFTLSTISPAKCAKEHISVIKGRTAKETSRQSRQYVSSV